MGQGSGHLEYPDQPNDMRYKKNIIHAQKVLRDIDE
jgi:hypothetical protein